MNLIPEVGYWTFQRWQVHVGLAAAKGIPGNGAASSHAARPENDAGFSS